MTPQAPIDSPFGYRSTAQNVVEGIDLSGKVAFVTGGYSGLGTEIVRALASAGARVLVGARRPDKAAVDLADVQGTVEIVSLDLSDPASIDACIGGLTERDDKVAGAAADALGRLCQKGSERRPEPGWRQGSTTYSISRASWKVPSGDRS